MITLELKIIIRKPTNMQKYRVEIDDNGDVYWYKHNTKQLHRIDGPAVEDANGDKCWYQNGQRHRIDGPAVERANGDCYWYQNGKRHRIDGPAIEWANGAKYWYIEGKNLSEKEFLQRTSTCNGKIIEYEGNKYKLQLVEE